MNVQDIARKGDAPLPAPSTSPMTGPSSVSAAAGAGGILAGELWAGFRAWRLWTLLGWDDIRQRYRRSVLGPFWITLSMGIFIMLLGVIYSQLFHVDVRTYLPYLSSGFIVWGFMAAVANDACTSFHEGARLIKQIKLPYSVYILRIVWRNLIIFLHTVVIFVPIAIVFGVAPTFSTLYIAPGLLLICLNIFWVAMVLAILATRYRDITPIVSTIVQVMMFCTPIMWPVNSLGGRAVLAEINPAYHLIELVRQPMLGLAPDPRSWLVAAAVGVVGSTLAVWLLVNKARRIVFWL
jgi:ABC-type polysaccharide/polyol phosphate export permease